MTRQTFCIVSYAIAVVALFFFSAPGYALIVAVILMSLAFAEPVLALGVLVIERWILNEPSAR